MSDVSYYLTPTTSHLDKEFWYVTKIRRIVARENENSNKLYARKTYFSSTCTRQVLVYVKIHQNHHKHKVTSQTQEKFEVLIMFCTFQARCNYSCTNRTKDMLSRYF